MVVLVAAAIAVFAMIDRSGGGGRSPLETTVGTGSPGRAVPAGFLGLSLEYPGVEPYAGGNPAAIDPVFLQLVRNLAVPQPVLRIGGDSSDWTWWPVEQMARPPGVAYGLTPRWMSVTRQVAEALGARLILGINLEADSPELAAAEAQALIAALGPSSVQALELGNEPELYGAFPWYRTAAGRPVTGRSSHYDFDAFLSDFMRIAGVLPQVPLAGPSVSGPGWSRQLGRFIAAEPQVRILTLHHYPLQLCFAARHAPSVAGLLTPAASTGLAESFGPYAALAHSHGRQLRVDELNTVSCGADPTVSQSFASALWVLDALFEMVRAGVDGVNIHTFPGAGYGLFSFRHKHGSWSATVAPEYYGLLMFAEAAPAGARLLAVSGGPLKVWATRGADGRIRVVTINKGGRAETLRLRLPGASGAASLERLEAPSVSARSGVSLGGFSFGARTFTGVAAPRAAAVPASDGRFTVSMPAYSAALLTVRGG